MANREDHKARIDRMERDGVLSPSQAADLRDSVRQRGDEDTTRSRWTVRWIGIAAAAIVVVTVVAIISTGGGGPTPVQDVSTALNEPGGVGAMNATGSKLIGIAILLIVPLVAWVWMHNSLVAKEESVFEAWAQTESNYQRRADLVPALVESVSRYIQHESETFTGVTAARGEASKQLTDAVDDLIRAQKEAADALRAEPKTLIQDEEKLDQVFSRQASVNRSVSNLFAVAESYPDLRSADQFLELQAQLEGTENRINVARMRFNDAVADFNGTIRKLPWNLVASAGNFQRKAYFQSKQEARDAPGLGFK